MRKIFVDKRNGKLCRRNFFGWLIFKILVELICVFESKIFPQIICCLKFYAGHNNTGHKQKFYYVQSETLQVEHWPVGRLTRASLHTTEDGNKTKMKNKKVLKA